MKKYSNMLISAQRKSLLRIPSGYRATSAAALQVITSVVSINLLMEERTTIYETGGQVDGDSIWKRTINGKTNGTTKPM